MVDLLPDLSLRQSSITAVFPLFLTYYVLAVLAILPNTFLFRLLLQPVFVWQAWRCVEGVDVSAWLAQSLGLQSADRVMFWNYLFVAGVFFLVLRSFEWTFIIKEPLRRYGRTIDQNAPIEKRWSIPSVFSDAFDLVCNQRGIGWSWSPKSSSRWSTAAPPPESIPSIFASLLFNITAFDTAQYLVQLVCPTVSNNGGGSLFNLNLSFFPRYATAAFACICGGIWVYSFIAAAYRIATLIGRLVFRQPASHWPPISRPPWLSTSIHEFWTFRWHQLLRHLFITFGARPCGALLGRSGALMGGFAVSAVVHYVAAWGLAAGSNRPEFSLGGFFVLMGLGATVEDAFERATGTSVRGFFGWLWTTSWSLLWGTPFVDAFTRNGMLASEFFPTGLPPGKTLVDAIISLIR